jgi:predicted TIM-barrel fold metal-dependent hydrolase
MLYDAHVHINKEYCADYDRLPGLMKQGGLTGAALLSDSPNSMKAQSIDATGPILTNERRLETLMRAVDLCREAGLDAYPFYWIDPMEVDALDQVDMCVERGVAGFKAICSLYAPSHPSAMRVWARIAQKRKPILFHSGILYDRFASGENNRPIAFEPLLFIPGLKFALAHISWPWCDELVSMLGKWTCMLKKDAPKRYAELFIDTTPGTPELYREDALRKILTLYDYSDNIMFGTDGGAPEYSPEYLKRCLDMDGKALRGIPDVTHEQRESMYGGAFKRFVGAR